MRVDVKEGSQEYEYFGRRLTWGRMGWLESYVSLVVGGRRHIVAVGWSWAQDRVWVRRASWAT